MQRQPSLFQEIKNVLRHAFFANARQIPDPFAAVILERNEALVEEEMQKLPHIQWVAARLCVKDLRQLAGLARRSVERIPDQLQNVGFLDLVQVQELDV